MDGMDEFDHVYRASAVGHGQWRSDLGQAPEGRGKLVVVSLDLPPAARAVCEALPYTLPDNCSPTSTSGDTAVIASSAAIYPPTYYALVGWVTHVFEGSTTVYAMRALTAVLCTACIGLAVWLTVGSRPRTWWPVAGVALAWTPTALYSTTVVSPNGLEMALGLLLWTALIGLARSDTDQRVPTGPVVVVVITASAFAWMRPLSPIWLLLILGGWLVFVGVRRFAALVRAAPLLMSVGMLVILVAAVSATGWIVTNPPTDAATQEPDASGRVSTMVSQLVLWPLQVISGVPFRNNAAPALVYAFGIVVYGLVVAYGLRARARNFPAVAFVVCSTLGVALWYSWTRYPTSGPLWQGRYFWPVALGVVLMAAWAIDDDAGPHRRVHAWVAGAAATALAVVQVVALLFVLDFERTHSVLADDDSWLDAPGPVVAVVALLGCLTLAVAALRSRPPTQDVPMTSSDIEVAHGA